MNIRGGTRTRTALHGMFGLAGLDAMRITSVRHPIGRRSRLIRALGVDHVIDVGANVGQFGAELRATGFEGRIISVEPMAEAHAILSKRADGDRGWSAVRCALGDAEGELTLHIAGQSASSSLLRMLPLHEEAAPGTRYVGEEVVTLRRLDSILAEHVSPASRSYLKVDVQGYELAVLRGAGARLGEFVAIQLELSLVPLYADAPLAQEVHRFVSEAGYQLAGLETGFADPFSGRLLQIDGIYVRSNEMARLPGGGG